MLFPAGTLPCNFILSGLNFGGTMKPDACMVMTHILPDKS